MIVVFILTWVGCGVLAAANWVAQCHRRWYRLYRYNDHEWNEDKPFLAMLVLAGPVGLSYFLLSGGIHRYGFRFKKPEWRQQ